ncbi:MAG TPA: BON domain-containing protein [Kofleriaceae bacterium]|jgi:osmotically-inducible protein OsmY
MQPPKKSYDDITRATVPEPDSGFRPTKEQEAQARAGFRALDNDERALQDRVTAALRSLPIETGGVQIEVTGTQVALRGNVAAAASLRTIEDAVSRVPGVETIHDQLVVTH